MAQTTLPDVSELPKPPDEGQYRDVRWLLREGHARSRAHASLLLERMDDEVQLFEAQVLAPEAPPEATVVDLGRWQAMCEHLGEQWRHEPLAVATADAMGAALRAGLPRDVLADLAGDAQVRLRVASEERWIAGLPWELALGGELHVAREVPARFSRPSERVHGPIRVLFVATNPTDENPLDARVEFGTVQCGTDDRRYQVERCLASTRAQLAEQARRFQPHVVHYVGHSGKSEGDSFLILHDQRGATDFLDARALAKLLPASTRLLCLSTCVTGRNYDVRGLLGMATSSASLPTTIANAFAITQPGACAFWYLFYYLLPETGVVTEATARARAFCATLVQHHTADWASFVTVIRDGSTVPFEIGAREQPAMEPDQEDDTLAASYLIKLANEMAAMSGRYGGEVSQHVLEHSATIARKAPRTFRR